MSFAQQSRIEPDLEAVLAAARRGPSGEILIAGGGIGGLATALALAKKGMTSHVLERRPAFAEDGAGIQIGPNGTRILAELGIADTLSPLVGRPEAIRVRDAGSGRDLVRLPLGDWIERRHGAPYWTAHRKDLHASLAARVRADPLVRLSMSTDVIDAASDDNGVAVASSDGRTFYGRALIAADGLWSDVRRRVFGAGLPRFALESAARSVVAIDKVPPALHGAETGLWLSPKAHVVHYPVSTGSELAIVVILRDSDRGEDWSVRVDAGWIAAAASDFAPDLRRLLAAPESWRKWSLHTLNMPRKWTQGRIALLGDAAHPVLPFLAQGAVLALEDAVVLADTLAREPQDTSGALRNYERLRRPRAARVERASRWNGHGYHMSGVLASARDGVLASVPPERLMARYDWLYGWKGTSRGQTRHVEDMPPA